MTEILRGIDLQKYMVPQTLTPLEQRELEGYRAEDAMNRGIPTRLPTADVIYSLEPEEEATEPFLQEYSAQRGIRTEPYQFVVTDPFIHDTLLPSPPLSEEDRQILHRKR